MIFIKQVIFVKSVNYLVKRRGLEEAPLFRIPHSEFSSVRQWYRFRHFYLTGIRYTRGLKKMVGLIHDMIEHLVQLAAIILALLPGGVARHK